MKILIRNNKEYNTGVHPHITEIRFKGHNPGKFFSENRFPSLVILTIKDVVFDFFDRVPIELKLKHPSLRKLSYEGHRTEKLELDCPSLQELCCISSQLMELNLNCPSLLRLYCSGSQVSKLKLDCPLLDTVVCHSNLLTELDLNCPSLRKLRCQGNLLSNLNGLEFCSELKELYCSAALSESVEILKAHLPELVVKLF